MAGAWGHPEVGTSNHCKNVGSLSICAACGYVNFGLTCSGDGSIAIQPGAAESMRRCGAVAAVVVGSGDPRRQPFLSLWQAL